MTGVEEREGAAREVREIRQIAAGVADPELPFVTIEDLGILRDVRLADDGAVEVTITPTYSGCPALDTIRADLRKALQDRGFPVVRLHTVLGPAWTSDWISEAGQAKLRSAGIAPPGPASTQPPNGSTTVELGIRCPHCGSLDTVELSRFGSTACKAIRRCQACREPFDHVKPI